MSIRNGEPDLANGPWTHLAIIGITIVMALVLGYGVGIALNGKPESAGVAAIPPDASHGPGPDGTPTVTPTVTPTGSPTFIGTPALPATNTPAATVISAAAAPAATKPAAAKPAPPLAGITNPLPAPPSAQAPTLSRPAAQPLVPSGLDVTSTSTDTLTSILPTVTPAATK